MNLENLKNALLVMLVIMLVYVLYKRLIHILRKDQIQAKYPALPNKLVWTNNNSTAQIEVKLNQTMYLIVDVYDTENKKVLDVAEGEFHGGTHHFTFERSALPAGRYYYKVTSPYEQASQYFEV
jgi:hypothetical protein